MSLTVPALNYRSRGTPLTSDEIDSNFKVLSDFCNSLSALIGVSLQSDGTLKPNSVVEGSIADRSITEADLQLDALPVFQDSGTPNSYAITPNPAITAYADKMVFFVIASGTNTGTSSLNVNGLGAIPIYTFGTTQLPANTILAGGVFCVIYSGGAFILLGSSGSSGGSSGGSSTSSTATQLSQFSPAPLALPGAGNNAIFNHNIGVIPMVVNGYLVCSVAELGFSVGDQVPLDNFFDADGNPAFGIDITTTQIIVTQNVSPPYVNRRSATVGAATAITPDNWKLVVNATSSSNQTSTAVQPALELMAMRPCGGIGYGSFLFYISIEQSNAGNTGRLIKVDLTTAQVSEVVAPSVDFLKANAAPIKLSDGFDRVIFTTSNGTFTYLLNTPSTLSRIFTQDAHANKPCYADYSGGVITAVYAMDSSIDSTRFLSNIEAVKIQTSGVTVFGTVNLNLFDANIVDVDKFTAIVDETQNYSELLCQFNAVSRRLYVAENATGLLHIFQMTDPALDWKGWWALTDSDAKHGKLQYLKSIVIGTGGGSLAAAGDISMCVEYDMTTGAEKSICITQSPSSTLPGRVARVPWREGA